MNRNAIIAIIIILLIAIVGIFVFSQSQSADGKINTQINVLSQSALKNGDMAQFELKDVQGNPLAGQKVNITYNNENYSVITANDGKFSLAISGEEPGTYDVEISYGGDEKYNGCNFKTSITVEAGESSAAASASSDANSTASTVQYNNQTSSAGQPSETLYYDSELNVYYDANGVIRGGQSDGSYVYDVRAEYNNPDMIDEEGNLQ